MWGLWGLGMVRNQLLPQYLFADAPPGEYHGPDGPATPRRRRRGCGQARQTRDKLCVQPFSLQPLLSDPLPLILTILIRLRLIRLELNNTGLFFGHFFDKSTQLELAVFEFF